MKKYIQFLALIVLISMVMGCVPPLQNVKQTLSENATGAGAVGGGLVGAALGYVVDGQKGAMLGALIGAGLGAALGYQFTPQDQENLNTVLENPNSTNQKHSWCANSRSITTGDLGSCGVESKKIMMTPGKVQFQFLANSQEKRQCRDIEIEVMDSNGELESTTQKSCKGDDGKWHSVTT